MAAEKRLIDLEKARNNVLEILAGKVTTTTAVRISAAMEEEIVDAVEVVHGRWLTSEEYANQGNNWWLYCSECEQPMREFYRWGYCPNCGAKMDGDGK